MSTDIIAEFKDKKILVLGDIILDDYIWGEVTRISPEAPIPIVEVKKENHVPGGAANTAHNIVALGAKPFLLGIVGNDHYRDVLFDDLLKNHVETKYIVTDKKRPTTHKTRIISQSQQLLRIDYEDRDHVDKTITAALSNTIKTLIPDMSVVIISDYAKGVITRDLMQEVSALCKQHAKKLIIDPKPQHVTWYKEAYLITPNAKEAYEMVHYFEHPENTIDFLGNALIRHLESNVLITQGGEGMTLFEQKAKPLHIPTVAQEVYDVSGAGDTVVATLALALSCGASLKDAASIANHAAGIVVGKIGTAVVTLKELKEHFGH